MKAIVMADENGGIARNGDQPIHIPADLRRLKRLTSGQIVVMGRKTFDVIGKPLPDRITYVLTSDGAKFHHDHHTLGYNVMTICDLETIKQNPRQNEMWVLGGATVYKELIPYCDEIYVTQVYHDFHCDQFFPLLTLPPWKVVASTDVQIYVDPYGNEYPYVYRIYRKVRDKNASGT